MRTQGGFTFFNGAIGALHTGDFGQQTRWALELNAPLGPVVLKAEYVNVNEGLREINSGTPVAVVRRANLSGSGYYLRASYFVWGDRLINGLAGTQTPPRLFGNLKAGKTEDALQIVGEFDHLGFTYSASDGADATADAFVGDYGVDIVAGGVNYWYTKHVRLTANILYYTFTGPGPKPLDSGNNFVEYTFRVGLAL